MQYKKTCLIYQHDKIEKAKVAGLLEPLHVLMRSWESISRDFITHLLKVATLRPSWLSLTSSRSMPLSSLLPNYILSMTTQLFFKHVVKLQGVSTSIVSDRDSRFIGTFWTQLLTFLGTYLNISSSYHPQIDDKTKQFNCMLKEYLHHFLDVRQKNWVQLLDVA